MPLFEIVPLTNNFRLSSLHKEVSKVASPSNLGELFIFASIANTVVPPVKAPILLSPLIALGSNRPTEILSPEKHGVV